MKSTPQLVNVGCESCHGPGSKHIQAELGNNEAEQNRMHEAMLVGPNVKQLCFTCHDLDNSPNFEFEEYYEKIDHSKPADEE